MLNTYDFQISLPSLSKKLAVRDLLFAYYLCPQVLPSMNLYSHYNEILFTLNGCKKLNHRDKSWYLTNENAIFIKRGAYNQQMVDTVGWEVMAFYFPDEFLQQGFKTYRQTLPLHYNSIPSQDMLIELNVNDVTRAFFYSMLPYFSQKISPAENILELKFRELLFNILTNPHNSVLLDYVSSIADQTKPRLQEIMEANYTFNLSLSEFARIAHRSLAAFKREFDEVYHTSPGKWLTNKRLEYAHHLLNTSSKNVKEIAYDSGFENATHFIRIFKNKFGMAPLQYRKQKSPASNTILSHVI